MFGKSISEKHLLRGTLLIQCDSVSTHKMSQCLLLVAAIGHTVKTYYRTILSNITGLNKYTWLVGILYVMNPVARKGRNRGLATSEICIFRSNVSSMIRRSIFASKFSPLGQKQKHTH